jgi:hypothetical protein
MLTACGPENVRAIMPDGLAATPLQLLIEAFHQARRGEVVDVVLVIRRPNEALQIACSGMTRASLAECAARLSAFTGELVQADRTIDDALDVRVFDPEQLT